MSSEEIKTQNNRNYYFAPDTSVANLVTENIILNMAMENCNTLYFTKCCQSYLILGHLKWPIYLQSKLLFPNHLLSNIYPLLQNTLWFSLNNYWSYAKWVLPITLTLEKEFEIKNYNSIKYKNKNAQLSNRHILKSLGTQPCQHYSA